MEEKVFKDYNSKLDYLLLISLFLSKSCLSKSYNFKLVNIIRDYLNSKYNKILYNHYTMHQNKIQTVSSNSYENQEINI
jgi:hypothetical protein